MTTVIVEKDILEVESELEQESGLKLPLELHELLDRYELLFPDVTELADFRRTVIDKDLSSIFRLNPNNDELRKAVIEENLHSIFRALEAKSFIETEDLYKYMEDVRKAVVNKNLRSIFKLLNATDLRKVVLDKNYWKLWPLLEKYVDTQFTAAFKNFYINKIEIDSDCFSRGQLLSKQWIIEELEHMDLDLGIVYLCAGWYATLATMLLESDLRVNKVRSFDTDPEVAAIAKIFNKPWVIDNWRFQAVTKDIHKIDYRTHEYKVTRANGTLATVKETPDTIVNTSCEHIEDFESWYESVPNGKLVILQSNNFKTVKEHINCVNNLFEFKRMAHMTVLLYEGELDLGEYKRFMLIGRK